MVVRILELRLIMKKFLHFLMKMDTRGGSSATTLMFEAWQQLKHLKRLELLQVLDLSYNEEDTCANQHFWGVYLLLNLVQLVIVGNAVVVSLARG